MLRLAGMFWGWPRAEKKLFFWAGLYLLKNWYLLLIGRGHPAHWIFKPNSQLIENFDIESARLALISVKRWTNRWPEEPNCLLVALTLRDLLRSMNVGSRIEIAFRKTSQGKLEFHALLKINGGFVFGQSKVWLEAKTLNTHSNLDGMIC